jgi:polyhydroxybutyrate depolymerase
VLWTKSLRAASRLGLVAGTFILLPSGVAHGADSEAPACRATPPAGASLDLRSGGFHRSALVHVPRTAARGRALPVVLAFHGSGANGPFMERYSGLSRIAEREGFLAIYPTSAGPWNTSGNRTDGRDDVRFASDLLEAVRARWCVDRHRVYATGVSSGATMAARLGCDLSARIAAVAPVAGRYDALPRCHPDRPVSVLEIHGTADRIVPLTGPKGVGGVAAYLSGWRRRDRCDSGLRSRTIAPRTTQVDTRKCADGSVVRQIEIVGGGHQYPGATPPDAGPPSTISAARETWRFFAGVRLARA